MWKCGNDAYAFGVNGTQMVMMVMIEYDWDGGLVLMSDGAMWKCGNDIYAFGVNGTQMVMMVMIKYDWFVIGGLRNTSNTGCACVNTTEL